MTKDFVFQSRINPRSLGNTNLLTNDEIINSQETVSIPLLYYNLYSRYTYCYHLWLTMYTKYLHHRKNVV
jgi:hypothetical protein